jgi:16S rRNA (cytosine967-C5)-methyltransferase
VPGAAAEAATTTDSEKPAGPVFKSDWHGAAQDIAYRTLRELALADALIAVQVPKPPAPGVRDLLACGLALLNAADTPYTSHTVVDQTVHACAAAPETAFARGLVNAVLRNFLRERDTLLAQVRRDPVVQWNYPRWWIDAVRRAWPTEWESLLAAGNVQAPLTLRVNRRHSTPEAYLARLSAAGMSGELALPSGVRLHKAVTVDRLPGFSEGVVSVQDSGAQHAAHLLEVSDGMRVLDACAAPGGKTGHLLELADIEVVALESDAARARRIGENLARLNLRAEVTIGDAGDASTWWDGKLFDRILADVPCSASGIVRRHPDIRWLRRREDIPALVAEQRRILDALWTVLAPGGVLLYVTCSIFPEEGEMQAAWFERSRQDAVRLNAFGQLTPTVARDGSGPDHDGFFYARFQKR